MKTTTWTARDNRKASQNRKPIRGVTLTSVTLASVLLASVKAISWTAAFAFEVLSNINLVFVLVCLLSDE